MTPTKSKIALLFTTRNNYQLFDDLFFEFSAEDFSKYHIFNIDMDSSPQQKQLAENIFKKYNITNIEVDAQTDPHVFSVQRDIELCIEYVEKNNFNIDWILWFSHDCAMAEGFLTDLEIQLKENPRFHKEVGIIGFCDYNQVEAGKPLYGRGNLIKGINEVGRGWYQDLPEEYKKADYFVVEAPNDNGLLLNISLWREHIQPDYNFVLFVAWDDICAQFALAGVPSITIPSLKMYDLHEMKLEFGIPRSLTANPLFHVDDYKARPWIGHWEDKYKWTPGTGVHYESNPARIQFLEASEMYEGSLQKVFFELHINDGPQSIDDIKSQVSS